VKQEEKIQILRLRIKIENLILKVYDIAKANMLALACVFHMALHIHKHIAMILGRLEYG